MPLGDRFNHIRAMAILFLVALFFAAPAFAQQVGQNMAVGKKYSIKPGPNYSYCTDPDDRIQLTDGKLTEGYFWTQKSTVGWTHPLYAAVTVDLGRVEPIGGASFRTAAGSANVCWPSIVRIHVSDDGKTYRDVGDLVSLDHEHAGPWPKGYGVRQLKTTKLKTRGRFVRFVAVATGPYLFVDEVEVFRGPDKLLQKDPGGEQIGDLAEHFAKWRNRAAIRQRFENDLRAAGEAINAAKLDESTKARLSAKLTTTGKTLLAKLPPCGPSFRAVLPLSEPHAQVFAVHAELCRALGRPALSAHVPAVWDPVELFEIPPTGPAGPIAVHTMRGEYRAAALNLYNSTDRPLRATLSFDGLSGSPAPGYVTVHDVTWTDTIESRPIAAALPEAKRTDTGWSIEVLPGLTGQVWFTFHVTALPPGKQAGSVVIKCEGLKAVSVPVSVQVYPLDFPKQTSLRVGGWSYTDGRPAYGVNRENLGAFLKHMRSHHVNALWAGAGSMLNFDVAADGSVKLDTAQFDDWIRQWPEARDYLVFLAIGDYSRPGGHKYRGTEVGSPEFDKLVGAWISAWVKHLRTKGVSPNQLSLLIHDEPHEGTDLRAFLAWAKAIRAAEPEVVIWEDPTYRNPAKVPAELFEAADVLCPNRPMWLSNRKAFERVYLQQKQKGRRLQSYSCSGPAKLLDPYSYHRLQAWHCWHYGGNGSYFWALGDNSGSSSWNEYLARSGPYTPLFIDEKNIVAGKHMEAIRESAQDYEYFVMLRAAVDRAKAAGRADAAVAQAETLLKTAAAEVLDAPKVDQIRWHDAKDRSRADAIRVRLLEAITSLK